MKRTGYVREAFRLVFTDRSLWWRAPSLAALSMIPILGSIVELGYLMVLMRNTAWRVQRGLPPFRNSQVFQQGATGFVVSLVWGLLIAPLILAVIIYVGFMSIQGTTESGVQPALPWWFSMATQIPSAILMVFVYVGLLRAAVYLRASAGLSVSGIRTLIERNRAGFRLVAWHALGIGLLGTALSLPAGLIARDPATWQLMRTLTPFLSAFLVGLIMVPLRLVVAASYGNWAADTEPSAWPPLREPSAPSLRELSGAPAVGEDPL